MKNSYRERDYTFAREMLTLRNKIGMTQVQLGKIIGISGKAVSEWETGNSYPQAGRLKAFIALAVQYQAFAKGREAEEIRTLWKVARQKVLLDEHWLSTLIQGQAQELHVEQAQVPDIAPPPVLETTNHTPATTPPGTSTKGKSDDAPAVPLWHEHEDAKTPQTTRQHKRLLGILITLVIVAITGASGMLLLQIIPTQTHSSPGYLPGNGRLVFFDPLSKQDGSKWDVVSTSSGASCQFTRGAYHVSHQSIDYLASCLTEGTFSNFAFEVQLTIVQGDCGGMVFRDNGDGQFYYFHICEDGGYRVSKRLSYSDIKLFQLHYSSAIHRGLGKPNKIAVVAAGSSMTFYVNEQQITQVQDSSYTSGSIALIANPGYGHATDVAYSNARLWTL